MSAHKGDTIKIKKDGVVICSGINQKDISLSAGLIEDTANSNRNFAVYLPEVDVRSVSIDFKGIAKDRMLRKLRLTDSYLLQNVTFEFGNGDTITGNFVMGDYSESGGYKDAIQFSCSLKSSGTYSYTFSATESDSGGAVTGGGGSGGGGGGGTSGRSRLLENGSYRLLEVGASNYRILEI